jgi:hypothetical protein
METDFVKNLFLRAQIGGNINPSEMLLIIKNLIERIETLEKKLDDIKPSVSRTKDSKVSKRKTTSS